MVQAFMTSLRTIALFLATILPGMASPAQQAITPPSLDRIAEVSPITAVAPVTPKAGPGALPVESAPASRGASEHKFFDRQQLLALSAHSGIRLADTIKTCRELSHGGVEEWIPAQSCGGVAAWQAGSVGLALGVGWIFHHYGRHRLERLTPWVGTGASAAGLTKSVFNLH